MSLRQFEDILDSDMTVEEMLETMEMLEGSTPQAQ